MAAREQGPKGSASKDWGAHDATNHTDGIINISNADSTNMGPSSMNAEVRELI